MDTGLTNAIAFLDLSKGFDTLNIQILLKRLTEIGVSPESLAWFESYLCERKQFVFVNKSISKVKTLHMGVPQGTVLGPIFFLIYVNDLPKSVSNGLVSMYADDTTIICNADNVNDLQDNINRCLHDVAIWFNSNRLVVNASKSNFMLVGTHQKLASIESSLDVRINDCKLQECTSAKLLGVILDQHLSFDEHVIHLCKKIAPRIGIIHRLRRILPINALNTIYITCIQSLMDYCLSVYGNTTNKNKSIVQKLQIDLLEQ